MITFAKIGGPKPRPWWMHPQLSSFRGLLVTLLCCAAAAAADNGAAFCASVFAMT